MNNVAILPKTIMYLLQNQNVKREVAKKADTTPRESAPVESGNVPVIIPSVETTPVSDESQPDGVGGTNIADLTITPA